MKISRFTGAPVLPRTHIQNNYALTGTGSSTAQLASLIIELY